MVSASEDSASALANELCEEFGEIPVTLDEDMSNVIVVDGIPIAPESKLERLVARTQKLFGKFGKIAENGIYVPMDSNSSTTLGYAFIEFESSESAQNVLLSKTVLALDKSHRLKVNLWNDFERFESLPEEYEEVKLDDLPPKENLRSWLVDKYGREMYVLRFGKETHVYWNDPVRGGRELNNGGESHKKQGMNWTLLHVQWSPLGSYLGTFHAPGVALWGGPEFNKITRLSHENVKLMQWSPLENFLITFNGKINDKECFRVWDVQDASLIASLSASSVVLQGEWPIFKWSYDEKYLARRVESGIQVFNLGEFSSEVIEVDAVVDFEWSPSDNIISYWVPESNNVPATVTLISYPEKSLVRQKHLFQVIDLNLHWQSKGDFLCVKVSRSKKPPKVTSTNFEIFRLREKDVPVEVVEMTDPITAFSWEPKGDRFAIIHENPPNFSVSFYIMKKSQVKLDHTLTGRTCNAIFWSPSGNDLVLANLGGQSAGQLEFYSANFRSTYATGEQFQCSFIEWDPSGRYLTTASTQPLNSAEAWKFAMNNGYRIWSVTGNLLKEYAMDHFYQFLWRPRPATLLSQEEIQDIRKNLRDKYYKKFDDEDEAAKESLLSGEAKKRVQAKLAYKKYRSEKDSEYKNMAQKRKELRGGYASDDESYWEVAEVLVEEEVSFKEEILE